MFLLLLLLQTADASKPRVTPVPVTNSRAQTGDFIQDQLRAVGAAGSGVVRIPNLHGSASQKLTRPLQLSYPTGNNLTFLGSGPFESNLAITPGPDFVMLDENGASYLRRSNRYGVNFFGAAIYGPSGSHPCVVLNSDSSYDAFSSVNNCGSHGYQVSPSGFASHHLFLDDYFLSNDGSGRFSRNGPAHGGATTSVSGASDWVSIGNLNNFNLRYGVEVLNDGRSQENILTSLGEHFEANQLGAFNYTWVNGVNHLSDYFYNQNGFLGPQTRSSVFAFNMLDGNYFDQAGMYNVALYNNCQLHVGTADNAGPCALRNKFPLIEDYLDTSEVEDWDMTAADTSSWIPGLGATISKTRYMSQTSGTPWLRISCEKAPCRVSQTVTDHTGGSHFLRVMYASGDTSAKERMDVEVVVSSSDGVIVDSKPLTTWGGGVEGTPARNDQSWETTFDNSGSSYTLTLKCLSARACYFADIRDVRNDVRNPSFERGPIGGGAPVSWIGGGCITNSAVVHTGSSSVLCSGNGRPFELTQTPEVKSGDYYLVSAWEYVVPNHAPAVFVYGDAASGIQQDSIYSCCKFRISSEELGVWQKLSAVIQVTDAKTALAMGSFYNGLVGAHFDDVSVLRLHANKQHARDDFTALTLGGSSAVTGIQGTTGLKLVAATGRFTPGDMLTTDADGNLVDAGVGLLAKRKETTAPKYPVGPRCIVSAPAGSGATCHITGNNLEFTIDLTTGEHTGAPGRVFMVVFFGGILVANPIVVFSANNAAAAAVASSIYNGEKSSTGISVEVGGQALAPNTTYSWDFILRD